MEKEYGGLHPSQVMFTFMDGESHSDCHPAGPHVLHAGSSLLKDATVRSVKGWMNASHLAYTCLLSPSDCTMLVEI